MAKSRLDRTFGGRTVLVTGHTGFIGSWLTLWLHEMGANVVGYSLGLPTKPAMFGMLGLEKKIASIKGDVRDFRKLRSTVLRHRPEFVFHLAAQPIVRLSYDKPLETLETNIIGTANLLESARSAGSVRSCVVFTSDKCYANRETGRAYREDDPMGGHDPYSSSKGAAELVSASFRSSFFNSSRSHGVAISTARAGNVIGGGDWAQDRIVPDCMSALSSGTPIRIRNPGYTRPFQHVLEPVSGILCLAMRMREAPSRFSEAWNFGPRVTGTKPAVRDLVNMVIREWGAGRWVHANPGSSPHEASTLFLDSSKANRKLGWRPVYSLSEAVAETVSWYRKYHGGKDMREVTLGQLQSYREKAEKLNIIWAR